RERASARRTAASSPRLSRPARHEYCPSSHRRLRHNAGPSRGGLMKLAKTALLLLLGATAANGALYSQNYPPPPPPPSDNGGAYPPPGDTYAPDSDTYGPQGDVDVNTFYDQLSPYGDWVQSREYGWVWVPNVDAGWRPYTEGRWVYTDFGWTWVDDEEWGWAPFHYGRWYEDASLGWAWVPGSEWGPAWVSWQ